MTKFPLFTLTRVIALACLLVFLATPLLLTQVSPLDPAPFHLVHQLIAALLLAVNGYDLYQDWKSKAVVFVILHLLLMLLLGWGLVQPEAGRLQFGIICSLVWNTFLTVGVLYIYQHARRLANYERHKDFILALPEAEQHVATRRIARRMALTWAHRVFPPRTPA